MSESKRPRRWWPYVVLVMGLGLLGAPLAWKCRPLNETERQLVGSWAGLTDRSDVMRFRSDRRFDMTAMLETAKPDGTTDVLHALVDGGTWTASSCEIHLRISQFAEDASWHERLSGMVDALWGSGRESASLQVETSDQVTIGGNSYVRIPDPTP